MKFDKFEIFIDNNNIFIDKLLIVLIILLVIFVISIFFILKLMGNDERADTLISRVGSFALLINVFLNSLLVNLDTSHWKFYLVFNVFLTSLFCFTYTLVKYIKFLK